MSLVVFVKKVHPLCGKIPSAEIAASTWAAALRQHTSVSGSVDLACASMDAHASEPANGGELQQLASRLFFRTWDVASGAVS